MNKTVSPFLESPRDYMHAVRYRNHWPSVATEHVKCSWSKLRCTVPVNYTQQSSKVWKM